MNTQINSIKLNELVYVEGFGLLRVELLAPVIVNDLHFFVATTTTGYGVFAYNIYKGRTVDCLKHRGGPVLPYSSAVSYLKNWLVYSIKCCAEIA